MPHLITKQAWNVLNARLPDMVWSHEVDDVTKTRFAHYFERHMVPVEFESFQEAFNMVQSMVSETPLLFNAETGQLYFKDSMTPEIYESAYSIVDTEWEGKL